MPGTASVGWFIQFAFIFFLNMILFVNYATVRGQLKKKFE